MQSGTEAEEQRSQGTGADRQGAVRHRDRGIERLRDEWPEVHRGQGTEGHRG